MLDEKDMNCQGWQEERESLATEAPTAKRESQAQELSGKDRETESKKAYAEHMQLLDAMTSILISLDSKNTIVRWNAEAARVLGVDGAEALGRTISELDIAWDFERVASAIETCKREGASWPVDDLEFTRGDGMTGYLGLKLNPIDTQDPGRSDVLLLGADITERKILEAQLRQAQKLETIGQLASGIAHEINTPTQYVGDNLQFLQESFSDILSLLKQYASLTSAIQLGGVSAETLAAVEKDAREADLDYLFDEIPRAIQQSLEGVERVVSLVQAMKGFAHRGTGEMTPTDLNQCIERTITVARNEWKYVASMKLNCDPNLPLAPCLPDEFNQVILNLIINAAHAIADVGNDSDRLGEITISSSAGDAWVEIRISDTGTGIPEEIRPKIFESFFTTKEVGRGSGQGLAISRSIIVDKHGGTLDFETEPGKGTTFIVRLPLASELPCTKLENADEV